MTTFESYVNYQKEIFQEAHKLLSQSQNHIPNLRMHFPQSITDIETQEFNLSMKIPTRLSTEEDIAMWILESDKIIRSNALAYLSNAKDPLARGALEKLAIKICSLEIAHGFVDGIKYYLPVIGCDHTAVMRAPADADTTDNNLNNLRYFLKVYVQAHLLHSSTPLFNTGYENVPVIVELALCVLRLCELLKSTKKPQAVVMSEFFASVRTVLAHGHNLTMTLPTMTELFNACSTGRPLSAIALPSNLPSYLYTDVKRSLHLSLQFGLDEAATVYYTRLCSDALYLFKSAASPSQQQPHPVSVDSGEVNTFPASPSRGNSFQNTATTSGLPPSPSHGRAVQQQSAVPTAPYKVVACIPLESVHVRLVDQAVTVEPGENILHLSSVSDKRLPFVRYNCEEYYASLEAAAAAAAVALSKSSKSSASKTANGNNSAAPTATAPTSATVGEKSADATISTTAAPITEIPTVAWPGPKAVTHHSAMYLSLLPNHGLDAKQTNEHDKTSGDSFVNPADAADLALCWLDDIENSCWETRAKQFVGAKEGGR